MEEEYLEVKNSPVSGKGVFALKDFEKGEKVCFMKGELMNLNEMVKRVDDGKEEGSDPLGVDHELYIDLGELPRSINHSCNPNSFIRGRNELVAIKDIDIGEEITYDYSSTMNDNLPRKYQWIMKCKCGSKNCRKKVDQFKTLSKERQEFYIKNRFAPDFILEKFS